jgi:hypothetical protein
MADAAAEHFQQMVAANERQQQLLGIRSWDDRWTRAAPFLRFDRPDNTDDSLDTIASYLEPTDVLLDVGGWRRALWTAARPPLSRSHQHRAQCPDGRRVRGLGARGRHDECQLGACRLA